MQCDMLMYSCLYCVCSGELCVVWWGMDELMYPSAVWIVFSTKLGIGWNGLKKSGSFGFDGRWMNMRALMNQRVKNVIE